MNINYDDLYGIYGSGIYGLHRFGKGERGLGYEDKHETLAIYNYNREKICDLYDSQVQLDGEAFDITVTTEINGYHTLSFSIPLIVTSITENIESIYARYGRGIYGYDRFGAKEPFGNRNFRWDFLYSDYLILYTCDEERTWFVANKPVKSKSGKTIIGKATCNGFESLLKTRGIYKYFDDENGIGTIQYLIEEILKGTGWHFNAHMSDTMLEKDGTTEKIRSLTSDSKNGALDLITTVCNLFQARPVYDTDRMEVYVKAMNNRVQVLEGVVGKNMSSLSESQDSSNIATRVYVEGEYGDYGYVGIDDVLVDENGDPDDNGEPWGLPFLMNFDYYRKIGVMKPEHEAALATYLHDIRIKKAEIRENGALMIAADDTINNMIGQARVCVYYKSQGFSKPVYRYGGITDDECILNVGDSVVILKNDQTHTYETWSGNVSQLTNAYGLAKFVTKSAGKIGAAEVQIESKEKTIEQLQRKIDTTVKEDRKEEYRREQARLQSEINVIYNGGGDVVGLYDMMYDLMKGAGYFADYKNYTEINDRLNEEQDDIEATFIAAMGYLLRDGYWSNENYITGQEKYLYLDAQDMVNEMSRPATNYTFDYVRVTTDFDIPMEDIECNAIFRLYDEDLDVDDAMFITKVTYGVDKKNLGSIEVSNQDITLTGNDLGSLLSRMSQLADLIEQKNALYERAKALTADGSMFTDRLEGQINVLKTQLMSTVSNWYTDDNGNLMFESADGGSAMMLSGAGWMIADGKLDDGSWNFRTAGDGHGLTADEIVAGFLSVDRIEAGTISVEKVTNDFGKEIVISSSRYIKLSATDFDSLGDNESGIYLSPTEVKINSGGTFELHATNLDIDTNGTVTARSLALNGGSISLRDSTGVKFSVSNQGYMTSISGNIAGWEIGELTLTGKKTGLAKTTNDDDIAIWAGNTTAANGNFRVTQGGKLYALSCEIKGDIQSGSTITGATISGGTININSGQFEVDSGGNVTAKSMNLTGGSINIANGVFSVDKFGNLKATSAEITGSIKSGSTITGAVISGSSFTCGNGAFYVNSDGDAYINRLAIKDGSGYRTVDFSDSFSNAVSKASGSWSGMNFVATLAIFGKTTSRSISVTASVDVGKIECIGYLVSGDTVTSSPRIPLDLYVDSKKNSMVLDRGTVDVTVVYKGGYGAASGKVSNPSGDSSIVVPTGNYGGSTTWYTSIKYGDLNKDAGTRVLTARVNLVDKTDTTCSDYKIGWNDARSGATKVDRYTRTAVGGGGAYGGNNYAHYIYLQGKLTNIGTGWYQTSYDNEAYHLPAEK